MNPITLTTREIIHRWKTSLIVVLLVAAITGTLTFFQVNHSGFEREISRNARDIGSNIVILPAEVDQFQYHSEGGYSELTMPFETIQQIVDHKASLNHLIPMLERKADCSARDRTERARVVGLSASIPMPGRPKAPMQKSIGRNEVQLGSELARSLGIDRDEASTVEIAGVPFSVKRVNRGNGTWQDAAAFIDLATAQSVFGVDGRISRIEAIECTDERCAETGLVSEVVLANELASITDQALILRREKIAVARQGIRTISQANLQILESVLWVTLIIGMIGLASLNSFQRQAEIGILQSLGYGQVRIIAMIIARSTLLTLAGSASGIVLGGLAAYSISQPFFLATGNKFSIDWPGAVMIGMAAILMAAIASSLPALLAAMRHPADLIGKES